MRDLATDWKLTTLAARCAVSAEHLRRICRRELGRTPMEHVTYMRIQRAQELLEKDWGVAANVWSCPSFNELARDGQDCERFNLLHPAGPEAALMPDPWLTFTGSYEFMPGQPRHFHVRTGSDGKAAFADLRGVRNQALLASALTALGGLLLLVLLIYSELELVFNSEKLLQQAVLLE